MLLLEVNYARSSRRQKFVNCVLYCSSRLLYHKVLANQHKTFQFSILVGISMSVHCCFKPIDFREPVDVVIGESDV